MKNESIEKIHEVADKLGIVNVLCQLAEENNELAIACLKYRRVVEGLTPKTEEEVYKNLVEEIGDVLININQTFYMFAKNIEKEIADIQDYKADRWWRRTFISQKEE